MIRMASVEQALQLISGHAPVVGTEPVALSQAFGRRLAEPVIAQVNQPPADVSAMDGYAVVFDDVVLGSLLKVTGESRAGAPWGGTVNRGEAVRIFTGAHVPP